MPRSISDGGGSNSLFRSVFAQAAPSHTTLQSDHDHFADATKELTHDFQATIDPDRRRSLASLLKLRMRAASLRDINRISIHRPTKSAIEIPISRPTSLNTDSSKNSCVETVVQSCNNSGQQSPVSPSLDKSNASVSSLESAYRTILHHGEALLSNVAFRRKTEYLVLTDRNLFRFRSLQKAADCFPALLTLVDPYSDHSHLSPSFRQPTTHRESPIPLGSPTHPYPLLTQIPLKDIIATETSYNADQTRLTMTISTISARKAPHVITVNCIPDSAHWITTIPTLVRPLQYHFADSLAFPYLNAIQLAVGEDATSAVADPHVRLFFVHLRHAQSQHAQNLPQTKSHRDQHHLVLLLVGDLQLHILTLPKHAETATRLGPVSENSSSSSSVSSQSSISNCQPVFKMSSHGLMNVTAIAASNQDNVLTIHFRKPMCPSYCLELASVHVDLITLSLHQQLRLYRPVGVEDGCVYSVPESLHDQLQEFELQNVRTSSLVQSFDLTFRAYCSAFELDPAQILYRIDEDSNRETNIQLVPTHVRQPYSILEILAFMRSLRYNRSFSAVSFAQVSMTLLLSTRDQFGDNHVVMTPSTGKDVIILQERMSNAPMLFQELVAIMLTNPNLRHLDLSDTICRNSTIEHSDRENVSSSFLHEAHEEEVSLMECLYPVCVNNNTNLNSIALNNLPLTNSDIAYLISLVSRSNCRLKALQLRNCQIDSSSLQELLENLSAQCNTLESLDISRNPAMLNPRTSFVHTLIDCSRLRQLNISNLLVASGSGPLIPYATLCSWDLTELRLSQTNLNSSSVSSLLLYLQDEASLNMMSLYVDGCWLTSLDIQRLCTVLSDFHSQLAFHLDASANRTEDSALLIDTIEQNKSPHSLGIRGLEFSTEGQFKRFLCALQDNTSTKVLDISEMQFNFGLTNRLSDDLTLLFSRNIALHILDMSGEHSRLESISFGSVFVRALLGLVNNKTLQVIKLRHQTLGIQGASVLAEILKKNSTLREIYCEHNQIPLTGVELLNNALSQNTTVTHLPDFEDDKNAALGDIQTAFTNSYAEPLGLVFAKPKEFLNKFVRRPAKEPVFSLGHEHSLQRPQLSRLQELVAQKWDYEQQKLKQYLDRNRKLLGAKIEQEYMDTEFS